MAQASVTPEQAAQAVAAVKAYGGILPAARALGIPRNTLSNRYHRALQMLDADKPIPLDTAPYLKRLRATRCRRFVITSAQNATPVHAGFFAALERYCRENRAHLIVIPYRYRNPTSIHSKADKNDDWWDKPVVKYLLDKRLDLNRNITVLADIKTQPTAVNPLSGFETISGSRSAVLGHSKIEVVPVATPHEKMAKLLITTGACTRKNYTETKAGKKGEFHHSLGAAVIEVDGNTFYPRQINATPDGSFIDLDRLYTPRGSRQAPPAEALSMGDTHVIFTDPDVTRATFGPKGMVELLRPKKLVWNDVLDFYSGSHHHRKKAFTNLAKYLSGMNDVAKELDITFAYMDRHTPKGVQNIVVASNHHEHFRRWVEEDFDPRQDPTNLMIWAETFNAMAKATKMTPGGATTFDPFAWWGARKLKCIDRTRFLKRDESCCIAGIEVGYHGDQGANGARGSLSAFNKIGAKTISGHSHTPGIKEGAYSVGTSTRLRLEYNHGPSSWLQTHCVIYANGKRSLLNVVGGRWRT